MGKKQEQETVRVSIGEMTRGRILALWSWVRDLESAAAEAEEAEGDAAAVYREARQESQTRRIRANRAYGAAQAVMVALARKVDPPVEACGALREFLDRSPTAETDRTEI